jgi:group I intron endonuclease
LQAEAENIDLNIVYEDDDLVVINKPKGMVVHPACGNWNGTLVNALLYNIKNLSGINAPYYGRHHTEETKKRYSEQRRGINNPFYGKKHTEESRLKIRDSLPKCSVAQIDIDTNEIINIFPSQKEAERQTNIYHSNISKCCKGKSKTAGGYKWKYINH